MAENQEKIQEVLTQVFSESDTDTQHQQVSRITFSTGVTFRVLPINIFILQKVMQRYTYPDVPIVHDDKLDRDIENPNSKHYIDACAKVDQDRGEAMVDTMAVLALVPLEVPDNIPPIESDEWIDGLEVVGITVNRENKAARKQAWVKFVAMNTAADFGKFVKLVSRLMGAGEAEVSEQMNMFQSNAE